jgi:hypothetical protein
MKLFLLNTRENNKPRKISFTILAFFYIFLHISKSLVKKKKEKAEQDWASSSPVGPTQSGNAPARTPALAVLHRGPRVSV